MNDWLFNPKKRMRRWPGNPAASTLPITEELMNRTANSPKQWIAIALIAALSAYFGAQLAVQHTQHQFSRPGVFMQVDDSPKPCAQC